MIPCPASLISHSPPWDIRELSGSCMYTIYLSLAWECALQWHLPASKCHKTALFKTRSTRRHTSRVPRHGHELPPLSRRQPMVWWPHFAGPENKKSECHVNLIPHNCHSALLCWVWNQHTYSMSSTNSRHASHETSKIHVQLAIVAWYNLTLTIIYSSYQRGNHDHCHCRQCFYVPLMGRYPN